MGPEELFANFDAEKQARYEAELVDRYGEDAAANIRQSKQKMAGWSKVDAERVQHEWTTFAPRLVELIDTASDDDRVQDIIAEHYRWVCNFWTPNSESYPGLGNLYADSPEFRAQFDAAHPRLAEFLRDAMSAYARTRLETM